MVYVREIDELFADPREELTEAQPQAQHNALRHVDRHGLLPTL